MRIEVKREHVRNGVKLDTEACAIALAINEVLPRACAIVDGEVVTLEGIDPTREYDLPFEVCQFIHKFDQMNRLQRLVWNKPFSFEIDFTSADTIEPSPEMELVGAL